MKKAYIIGGLFLAGFAAYWVAYGNPFKRKTASSTGESTDTSASQGTKTSAGFTVDNSPTKKDSRGFPLSQGSTGQYVKLIQQALNDRFGSELEVDGVFGTKTAKALSAHGFNPEAIYYKHFNAIVGYQYWG